MKRLAAIALFAIAFAHAAQARMIVYSAKNGDTVESIAADYYGNRSLSTFISEGNGLPKDIKLRAGQKVRIPTAFHYRVRRGDTLEALGGKFLDDKRRGVLLSWFNPIKSSDKLREGQDLIIPFQHIHKADAPESLTSVAREFYGDPNKWKLLMDFNFRTTTMLAKGERVILPIAHVRVRSVHLSPTPPPVTSKRPTKHEREKPEEAAPTLAAAPDKEAQKREAELAEKVSAQLVGAEKSYKEGAYEAVPAQLDKLLAVEDPSEAQLAEIFRLKAFAYVALGMDELAVSSFREVLARKPDLALDEATVSPKIRAALDRARAEAKSSAP